MIPIYKPFLPKSSLKYVYDALDSTWISSQGKYITLVQERLQDLLGVKYVLLTNNGTSACHLMAKALTKKIDSTKRKKLLVPDNSYVAAYNSFLFDDEYKLITIKSDINTWNIDLNDLDKKIKKHPDAKILIVHNIGNIINVPELQKKYPNTTFVEDGCEALFATYNGKFVGTSSFCSAFSTFANKTICTGEGGFVITNDQNIYEFIKCVHAQGQSEKKFVHNELGYNYRMTNIQASILNGQLDILNEILDKKNNIFNIYRDFVKNREDVFIQQEEAGTKNANWMFGIRIPDSNYDFALNFFNNRNVEIRPMFYPISAHSHLQSNKNVVIDNCSVAEQLNKECIILPSFPELSVEEQNYIIKTLEEYLCLLH